MRHFRSLTAAVAVTFALWLMMLREVGIVNARIKVPRMDEIFHIPQAQRLRRGDFSYDAQLTTPPGLYIASIASFWLLGIRDEGIEALRKWNAAVGVLIFIVLFEVLRLQHRHLPFVLVRALRIWFVPTIAFHHLLYYTDSISLFLVLLCFLSEMKRHHWRSAFFGALAVFVRQTNVLWVGCFGLLAIGSSFSEVLKIPRCYKSMRDCLRNIWPHLLIAISFLVFVFLNGGSIVLGDKSHHQISFHTANFLYYISYISLLSFPNVVFNFSKKRLIIFFIILPIFEISAIFGAVPHLFILSDNSTYRFHLWRHFLQFPSARAFILAPSTAFMITFGLSTPHTYTRIRDFQLSYLGFAFLLATGGSLIPAPLFEFRYFSIPTSIFLLGLKNRGMRREIFMTSLNFIFFILMARIFVSPFFVSSVDNVPLHLVP